VIDPYSLPGHPEVREVTTANNWAQSNHTQFISAYASPARREATAVMVQSERPQRQRHYAVVQQSSPIARTFIEHAWVELDPGEKRTILVFTEFMTGDDTLSDYVDEHGGLETAFANPNVVRLTGVAGDPCSGDTLGGASLLVRTGQATEFRRLEVTENAQLVDGRVVESGTNNGVNGPVIVTVRPYQSPRREVSGTVDVRHGDFEIEIPHDLRGRLEVRGHFLGTVGVAPCESAALEIQV
jgi:hypothetical protein